MSTTTNYGYNVPTGTDNVNILADVSSNFSMIDSDLKAVSDVAVGTATELLTGTVHALTRADTDRNVFHFTATANYTAGETFEVDGVQVTAKTPDGQNLSTGAYVINSNVFCILDGTLLTVMVNPAKALDSDKLDGHDSTYFATDDDLDALALIVGNISNKVGTGVLDVGNDCVDGINTLNSALTETNVLIDVATISGALILDANTSYKQGSRVHLECCIRSTGSTISGGSGTNIGRITTVAARPSSDVDVPAVLFNAATNISFAIPVTIKTDGYIQIKTSIGTQFNGGTIVGSYTVS